MGFISSPSSSTFSGRATALIALLSASLTTAAFDAPYCSSQNTGLGDAFTWPYQSNGKCTDHCNGLGTYAFAVVQFTDCWCSNYIPADQQGTSDCQVGCPGFPSEFCGDKDNGLYIYLKLAGRPSGTQGGSQPQSSPTEVSSPDPPAATDRPSSPEEPTPPPAPPPVITRVVTENAPTVIRTVTLDAPSATSLPSPAPVSTISTTETPEPSPTKHTTTTPTQPSTTEEPETTAMVITESGQVVTRTVVFSPTAPASNATTVPDDSSDGSKSNTGAIVGGVVGGVLGCLAILAGVIFLLWRKRRNTRERLDGEGGQSGLNRNTSTMSKNGLLGGAEKHQYPRAVATSGSQRSRHDDDSIGHMSASDRRYSQPVMVDSRLNPRAVLTFHGSNESRDSIASIDDSRDYGRQLNVVNPDPNRD